MKELEDREIRKLNEEIFPYWMKRDVENCLRVKDKKATQLIEFMNQGFCKIEEYRGFIPEFKMILEQGIERLLK